MAACMSGQIHADNSTQPLRRFSRSDHRPRPQPSAFMWQAENRTLASGARPAVLDLNLQRRRTRGLSASELDRLIRSARYMIPRACNCGQIGSLDSALRTSTVYRKSAKRH